MSDPIESIPVSLAASVGAALDKLNIPTVVETAAEIPPVVETPSATEVESPIAELEKQGEKPEGVPLPIDEVEDAAVEEPVESGDKAGMRIRELKHEVKTVYKPKIAELEQTVTQKDAEILELKGAAAKSAELEAKIAEYETEMSVVRLEKTTAYQEQITKPISEITKRVDEIAAAYGIDTKKLDASFEAKTEVERRKLMTEATSGLDIDQEDLFELRTLREKVQPIFAKQEELLANAEKALSELGARKEQETAAEAAARAEVRKNATSMVADRITAKLPFIKDAVGEVLAKTLETDFSALPVESLAYNALAGNALPKVAKLVTTQQAQIDALLDELATFKAAAPKVEGLASSAKERVLPSSLAAAVNEMLATK